jgi:hypothetical protein
MKRILFILCLLPTAIFAQTTNLFISEYGEGSGGSKKYIEIYNGTGATVDLANYQVWRSVNGAAWNTTPIVLTGSLANNDAYVIANNATDVLGADLYTTSISHNGDDAYALTWNGGSGTIFAIIDVFGLADGVDPGTSWTIAGNANASVDKILIRKPTVCSPNTDWAVIAGTDAASSQYTIVVDPYNATNQTTDLGMHTATCIASCNTTSSFAITNCTSYTVPSGDETYTVSGIYFDTIPNAAMCDSVMTIDLTITTGITYYADLDTDGLGDANNTTVGCVVPVGYVTNSDDCDDTDNLIGVATTTYYLDADLDTYGDLNSTIVACSLPIGYVTNSLDCDDSDNTINPMGIDIVDNGIDEDCSGSDASALGTQIGLYEFTAAAACPVTAVSVTTQPSNAVFSDYTSTGTSCSAAGNVFSNSGWNTTPTIDLGEYNEFSIQANDCSTLELNRIIFTHRISGSGGTPTWTLRSSIDNYTADLGTGTPLTVDKTDTINLPAAFDALTQVTFRFYITNMGAAGSTWRNDNVRVIGNFGSLTPQTYYADADNDTYGDLNAPLTVCTPPAGYVLDNTDCDDTDGLINPMTTWYQDLDGDLSGNTAVTFVGCTPPVGYVLDSGDCDDNDDLVIYPTTYYTDADNDGFGAMMGVGLELCTNPGAGYSTNQNDCDDNDFNVNPNSPEICDGADNNCNSQVDEGLTFINYYVDADNDGFGTGNAQSLCEDPGVGYSLNNTDCNDAMNTVYPGATEIADDGIDQNCDGVDGYLSIEQIDAVALTIYPNPSSGIFTVKFNTELEGNIVCVDLNGKTLKTIAITNSVQALDFSELVNGNYMLKIMTELGVRQFRIVIQK